MTRTLGKTHAMRISRKPGARPLRGDTDWARLEAMTDEEVLAAALTDPDAQPLSPGELAGLVIDLTRTMSLVGRSL